MESGRSDAPHLPQAVPIDAYGNGGFRFGGMSHRGSLLCLPQGMWAWPVTQPNEIDAGTLSGVIAAADAIDTLLVGAGPDIWLPPKALRELFRSYGIVIDAMQTPPAIRMYNIMVGERRRVAAALIAMP
jgi:uncharacterized protein